MRKLIRAGCEKGRGPGGTAVSPGLLAFVLLGAACAGNLVLLLSSSSGTPFDGWPADGIEMAAALMCLGRAVTTDRHRRMALALGVALLAWAVGDIVISIESLGGGSPGTPSLADAFYLGFYPAAYIAAFLFLRREVRRAAVPSWMDGFIAGLGCAAVSAEFLLRRISHLTGGSPLATATNLAYPVGDLLLLTLVIGGMALLPHGQRRAWGLLAAGLAVDVVGDSVNLLHQSVSLTGTGRVLDGVAWPVSSVLMAMVVWLRPPVPTPTTAPLGSPAREPGFVLPQLAGLAALAVLVAGTVRRSDPVAVALAAATLGAAGIRSAHSVRVMRDLSRERQRQSVTDELTGLANRRYLFDLLGSWFARTVPGPAGQEHRLAFLFLDLNTFKEINDSFGHPAGDELLRQLGPRLTGVLRTSDVLIRLGGDEFAVVLRDADVSYATEIAQRLTLALGPPFDLGCVRARIGASIGIALAPADGADAQSLMGCADVAMYRAKAGGLPFAVYDRKTDGAGSRMHSAEELAAAIDKGELVLHYQPQLDLRSRAVTGVEALVRWVHPVSGLIEPDRFLPLAEEAGLMRAVTDYVLDEALAQSAAWRRSGLELTMSVNVSSSSFRDPGFADEVGRRLAHHRLPADVLILEVTETTLIADFDNAKRVIAQLADLGVVVSIDDFGAGFTSLAYLANLTVGELKLDRVFVVGMAGGVNGRDADLVRATVHLAHALALRVVAEGVEDVTTLEQLAGFGCDEAQGYLVSRPLPAADLLRWLQDRSDAVSKDPGATHRSPSLRA